MMSAETRRKWKRTALTIEDKVDIVKLIEKELYMLLLANVTRLENQSVCH